MLRRMLTMEHDRIDFDELEGWRKGGGREGGRCHSRKLGGEEEEEEEGVGEREREREGEKQGGTEQ
jgi:hypothetical protein